MKYFSRFIEGDKVTWHGFIGEVVEIDKTDVPVRVRWASTKGETWFRIGGQLPGFVSYPGLKMVSNFTVK